WRSRREPRRDPRPTALGDLFQSGRPLSLRRSQEPTASRPGSRPALKIRRSEPLGQHRATLVERVVLHDDAKAFASDGAAAFEEIVDGFRHLAGGDSCATWVRQLISG